MCKTLLFFGCLVLCSFSSFSQGKAYRDVVRLFNGWVIRGDILEQTDSSVRIRTRDGNEFVFRAGEVKQIGREPLPEANGPGRRWTGWVELGPLIAGRTTQNGVTTAAFSFQTAVSHQWKPWFGAGIGVGADLYATQTLLPFFASIRGDWWTTRAATWYYFLDGGYGQNITQPSAGTGGFHGGALYAGGLGWRVPFSSGAGFLLSIGYRFQHTSYVAGAIRQPEDYRRLALRAGFYL
jgi:hypothetical protein